MSDGPFKNPLAKKCWQPVADRAANESFSAEQIREAIPAAFAGEFKDLPPDFNHGVERILADTAPNRLIDLRESGELDGLRRDAAGSALATLIVDCLEDALERGLSGERAIADGTAAALEQSYEENARGIEQHAQQDQLGKAIVQQIRSRLRGAAPTQAELEATARALWKMEESSVARTPPKHADLDEGPALGGNSDD
ncbi:MAG: hypothetical protein AB7L90_23790 [Hyphomicrobiaceae bacterium]